MSLAICLASGAALFGLMVAISNWAYAARCAVHVCGLPMRLVEMVVVAGVTALFAFAVLRTRWATDHGRWRLPLLLLVGLSGLLWFWLVRSNIALPALAEMNLVFAYGPEGRDLPESPGAQWQQDRTGRLPALNPNSKLPEAVNEFGLLLVSDQDETPAGGHHIALYANRETTQRVFAQARSQLEESAREVAAAPDVGESAYAAWLADDYHLLHTRCQAVAHLWWRQEPGEEIVRFAQDVDAWLKGVVCRARAAR